MKHSVFALGCSMPYPNPWSLITDYESGTPNGGYAEIFYEHLEALR